MSRQDAASSSGDRVSVNSGRLLLCASLTAFAVSVWGMSIYGVLHFVGVLS